MGDETGQACTGFDWTGRYSDLFFQAVSAKLITIASLQTYYIIRGQGGRHGQGKRNDDKMMLEENLRIWPGPGLAAQFGRAISTREIFSLL